MVDAGLVDALDHKDGEEEQHEQPDGGAHEVLEDTALVHQQNQSIILLIYYPSQAV